MLHQNSQTTLKHAGAENSCYLTRINGLAKVSEDQKQKLKD